MWGTRGVQTSQRTQVERRQVRAGRSAPHGPHGGGQACDFEPRPLAGAPCRSLPLHCLSASFDVSRQQWGLPGDRFSEPCQTVFAGIRLPPSGALPGSPTPAPKPGFVGRIRDKLVEPSEAPAGHGEAPAQGPTTSPWSPYLVVRQHPCCKGQNRLCWPQSGPLLSFQLPAPGRGRTAGLPTCPSPGRRSPRCGGPSPGSACLPGTSLPFCKPGLPPQGDSSHGPITRPPSQGSRCPHVTFG